MAINIHLRPKSRAIIALLLAIGLVVLPCWFGHGPSAVVEAQSAVPFHVPEGFVAEPVVTRLKLPTSFAFAGANRILITEKSGLVRVVVNDELQAEPFIDLSGEVNDVGQRGLLGIAVHPQFPATPYVYLGYVYDDPKVLGHNAEGARASRLLRLSADAANPNAHLPGSGVILLGKNSIFENLGDPDRPEKNPLSCEISDGNYIQDCLPNEGHVHAIAHIVFGRDGALYVANGDGLNYNYGSLRAQAIDSLAGKILRINPITGDGYPSNPFYDGNPQSNRSKVYVYGMKHPYRFAVHPTTGELLIGDVGNLKWEEVNRVRAGANLGWPCFEGENPNAFDPVCQPLLNGTTAVSQGFHIYPHEDGWGAVIGGDFYTGRAFPAYYRGAYFYGDFNKGTIQSVVFDRLGTPTYADFITGLPGLVQITSGPDGALYTLSIATGTLYRIRYVGAGTRFAPSSSTDAGASNVTPTSTPTVTPTAAPDEDAVTDTPEQEDAERRDGENSDGGNSEPARPEPTPDATSTKAAAPVGTGTGTILREWWTGIGGNHVADLVDSNAYAGKPSGSEQIRALEAPRLFGTDYGTRIRGYLYPPVTGAYRFWIAADDSAELWLSTDATPANRQRIAAAPEWTHAQQWDRYGAQQSVEIQLTAGQRYYIEVLHKQADQKDNLSVAWQMPGQERMVIDGAYLSPPE
ncbi:MAG: PQQ-dependent sugar dehydrogenase [Caldilineaceae bacterium]|nr:PQQ-dependent sugar dehydrogenase [Caldilineaceae bacterium]